MSILRRLPRAATATLAGLTCAVVLAACGGGEDSAAQPGANSSFNASDVTFAQEMIPHHLQAVKMASLAATRARDPEVKRLAAAIAAGQQPEIGAMQDWLKTWGQPLMAGMPGMDYAQMNPEQLAETMPGSMPGMASGTDLKRLSQAKGARFDRLFLTLMLDHHRGAVQMAQRQRSEGKAPAAIALATDIERVQSAEIARIERLQKSARA